MRSAISTLSGNLIWSRHGAVWAGWRLTGLSYGHRPIKHKREIRTLHQALMRGLMGESLWLGTRAGLDPHAVVERVLDGVDVNAHPDWAAECAATLDSLAEIGPGQRALWLWVPLNDHRAQRLAEPLRAALNNLRDAAGMPRASVSDAELERRRSQADQVAKVIPAVFDPQPVAPAQTTWLFLHAQQRGLWLDLDLPESGGQDVDLLRSGCELGSPVVDEGAKTDHRQGGFGKAALRNVVASPERRRLVKLTSDGPEGRLVDSYQQLRVLSRLPRQGMVFPGSEIIGQIDKCGLDVDWAMRMRIRSSDDAGKRNRKALVNLNDQIYQRSEEVSVRHTDLDDIKDALAEYTTILARDHNEVEVEATTVLAIAGSTPEACLDQGRELDEFMSGFEAKTTAPLGHQSELWQVMLPGFPATKIVADFAHPSTSSTWSAAVPFIGADLGDTRGLAFAINLTTGVPGVVHLDVAGASARGQSGSFALIGEKGGGKSYAMKKIAAGVIDQGGRVITPDRTPAGEWARWATSITSSVVADCTHPEYSLCPLRFFGSDIGSRVAHSFFITLLGVAADDDAGTLLGEILHPEYLTTHRIGSCGDLLTHLTRAESFVDLDDRQLAKQLARRMRTYANKDLGRVIFDPDLPSLPEAWRALVIRTHDLELPTRDQLNHEHLFRGLRIEAKFGRAMYALVAAMARQVCFADPTEPALFLVDEAHFLTASPEAEHEAKLFLRDDRKHGCALGVASHDAEEDFGSATLWGLIPTRILMRHQDRTMAARGLARLDLDPTDDDLLELILHQTSPPDRSTLVVPEHRRGEALMRDVHGRTGFIRVLPHALAHRAEAANTTPERPGGTLAETAVVGAGP